MTNSVKALAFGEVLFDVIENTEHLGGAPLNLAAHLAQCGAAAAMISAVGNDQRGEKAIKMISSYGVKTDYIARDNEHPTGIVNVELSDGQPSYTICRDVAYDYITLDDKQIKKIRDGHYDIFCFGTLAQRSDVSRGSLNRLLDNLDGVDVFYDVNLRQNYYSKEIIEQSLHRSDIVKLNDDEARFLSSYLYGQNLPPEEFARRTCSRYGVRIAVITMGERGSGVFADGEYAECPGEKVKVADTVGAGDAFGAAFIYQLYSGNDAVNAARIANKIGAYVASCNGAIPKYNEHIKAVLISRQGGP